MKTDGDSGGLYVHVPFCRHRCHFCSFLITTRKDGRDLWEEGLRREIALRAPVWRIPFDTIYFGGGTPSLLPAETVLRVLDEIRGAFDIAQDAEVSLEANPGDLRPGELAELRSGGVNRISLGLQAFHDEDLEFLTRGHSAAQGTEAVGAARDAGFDNITIDLMYGLPGRPRERLIDDLDRAVELAPDHISAYLLTIERGTPFYARAKRGVLPTLTDEDAQRVFLRVGEHLAAAGYERYEISSFARAEDFRSRHNQKYWEGLPYLGLGPAAHSFREPVRMWNLPSLRLWADALERGIDPLREQEQLAPEERRLERLFLGLRTTQGVPLAGLPAAAGTLIPQLVEEGKATADDGRLILTESGFALADGIATELSA